MDDYQFDETLQDNDDEYYNNNIERGDCKIKLKL